MADKPQRFVLIGDTILDFIGLESSQDGMNYQALGGGAIANVARHLAVRGHSVDFLTAFAPDPFGTLLKKELKRRNVSLQYAQTIAGSETPLCFISNGEDGERYFLHRGGDPFGQYIPKYEDFNHLKGGCLVWGISSMRTLEQRTLVDQLMSNRRGLTVCDPGTCPDWWGSPDALKAHLLERLPKIDILKCSLPEAIWLSGHRPPADATRWLWSKGEGAHLTIVTAGAEGIFFTANGEVEHFPVQKLAAIDTTGAGDATLAGFLDDLNLSEDPFDQDGIRKALTQGAAWGANTVLTRGAGPWFL